jgi:hypothetical protein
MSDVEFDTLEDLKKRMTQAEFIKYMVKNYPLLLKRYQETKQNATTLSTALIVVIIMAILVIFGITLYYRRKMHGVKKKCNLILKLAAGKGKV